MMRSLCILSICLMAAGLSGCGNPSGESSTNSTNADTSANSATETNLGTFARQDLAEQPAPAGITPNTPPDEIVAAFLNALRSGDSGVAEALLTRQAREETLKRDLTVQQLGAPEAIFAIGTTEYLDAQKNGAHVNTRWTEHDGATVINYDIVWALRRHSAGWRVAGMGAQLGPGQPIVYLNFEDPDDMLAKWRAADDTVAATESANSEIRQAQVPRAPDSTRR